MESGSQSKPESSFLPPPFLNSSIHRREKVRDVFHRFLTQDKVENTFSWIRTKRKLPTPKQFKKALRRIIVAMYERKIPGSNYDLDNRGDLVDFLNDDGAAATSSETSVVPDGLTTTDARVDSFLLVSATPRSDSEKQAFDRVAGYLVYKLLKENPYLKNCEACRSSLLYQGDGEHHALSLFTRCTNFKENLLVEVSDEVFTLLFHSNVEKSIAEEKVRWDLEKPSALASMEEMVLLSCPVNNFPQCHDVEISLINRFLLMCCRLGLVDIFADGAEASSSLFVSKSTASAAWANSFWVK